MRTAFFFFLHTLYFETRRGSHSNPLRIDICIKYYRININWRKSGLSYHRYYSWKSALKSHALRNGFCGIAVTTRRTGSHGGREQFRLEGVFACPRRMVACWLPRSPRRRLTSWLPVPSATGGRASASACPDIRLTVARAPLSGNANLPFW